MTRKMGVGGYNVKRELLSRSEGNKRGGISVG